MTLPVTSERRVVLDRFENTNAVLRTDDTHEEILWPKHLLPNDAHEGSIFLLTVKTEKEAEEERRALAKTLLNEILSPE